MRNGKNTALITSEDELLAIADAFFPRSHRSLMLGRGDDCAEFSSDRPLALSTDLFLEDVHFRRGYFTPAEIGHKALAVNLSDLAAAGAEPLGFSLGLICPPDIEKDWMCELFGGMSALAAEFDLPLSGGDISVADKLGFCLTVWGRSFSGCAQNGPAAGSREDSGVYAPFLRRGAEAGDVLFLLFSATGLDDGPAPLGLPRLGLELLEQRGRAALQSYPAACAALLRPEPLLACGRALALVNASLQSRTQVDKAGVCGAIRAMDLSDGLRRDLPRLLNGRQRNREAFYEPASALGAELDFEPAKLHPELLRYHGAQGWPAAGAVQEAGWRAALAAAFSGGDEYALLCACPLRHFELAADALSSFAPGTGLLVLGRASASPGVRWRGADINDIFPGGAFDHFRA